jgi:hypothetical protein
MDDNQLNIEIFATVIIDKNYKKNEYCKRWREANPDKMKLARDNWYYNNKDDITFKENKKKYQREYYNKKKQEKLQINF